MTSYSEAYRSAPLPASELERLRQSALDRLTEAFASDLVSLESYESRVGRAQNASSAEELDGTLEGIESFRPTEGRRRGAAQRPARASSACCGAEGESRGSQVRSSSARVPNRIDRRISGQYSIACVMGDRNLTGDWLSGDQVGSFTVMGSTKIDLRDTALPPGRLKIDAFCLMGETKIIVPHGLPVRLSAFPFMGEAHAARDVQTRINPGEPYVEVNGFAMMGSLVIVAMD